jgi:hypothetical protein
VDFMKGASLAFGEPWAKVQEYIDAKDGSGWRWLRTKHPDFWTKLPFMPKGKQFWNAIRRYSPVILTAAPITWPESVNQKKQWVARNLGPRVRVIVVSARTARSGGQTSNSSELKAEYAVRPHRFATGKQVANILVDDYDRNVHEWNRRGGVGIMYTEPRMQDIVRHIEAAITQPQF